MRLVTLCIIEISTAVLLVYVIKYITGKHKDSTEEDLDSHECKLPFYEFVTNKKKDIYIVFEVNVLRNIKKIEVSDLNRRSATIDLPARGTKDEMNTALLKYLAKLFRCKENSLSFKKINATHRIVKVKKYRRSKYSILYKIGKAWEPFNVRLSLEDSESLESIKKRYRDVIKKMKEKNTTMIHIINQSATDAPEESYLKEYQRKKLWDKKNWKK